MKYWRGYITAAILAVITWAVSQFAATFPKLLDMVYPYISRTILNFLSAWTSDAAFCLWQVLVVLLIAGVLTTIVLMIIFRWNFVQWLGWMLAGAMLIAFLHTGIYGLNYHASPLYEDLRMDVSKGITLEELQDATEFYLKKANALAEAMPRNTDGTLKFDSFEDLAKDTAQGFEILTRGKCDHEEHHMTKNTSFSVFAGDTSPVKRLGWDKMYTSMGITGITMPLTGEAAVNPNIPVVSLPFTMAHEMAHRMCIAGEGDANFAAFLTCRENSNPQIQYSAYFMAYLYCYNALSAVNDQDATVAAARIHSFRNEFFAKDMRDYNDYFSVNQDKNATFIANTANDTYIKASGDEKGISSYDSVSTLLVMVYVQEVILPQQNTNLEESFDPTDKNQVDLSGIVGTLPKN